jgi:hypothetical protein
MEIEEAIIRLEGIIEEMRVPKTVIIGGLHGLKIKVRPHERLLNEAIQICKETLECLDG